MAYMYLSSAYHCLTAVCPAKLCGVTDVVSQLLFNVYLKNVMF